MREMMSQTMTEHHMIIQGIGGVCGGRQDGHAVGIGQPTITVDVERRHRCSSAVVASNPGHVDLAFLAAFQWLMRRKLIELRHA